MLAGLFLAVATALTDAPMIWFSVLGTNTTEEAVGADVDAIADAGFSGIQLFSNSIGPFWERLVARAATTCRRRGLRFEMQICPGWSTCGGPWVRPGEALRELVSFAPENRPAFTPEDDYREICTLTFPRPVGEDEVVPVSCETNGETLVYSFGRNVTLRNLILPPRIQRSFTYRPDAQIVFEARTKTGWTRVLDVAYPKGNWFDYEQAVTFAFAATTAETWRLAIRHSTPVKLAFVRFSGVGRLDNWEAQAGWTYRSLRGPTRLEPENDGTLTRVFGHINAKRVNHPALPEATGWECDKLSPSGVRQALAAHLGRLADGPLAGGLLKGVLTDSWECGRQTWSENLEGEFERRNGYALRPHLPELFGYVPRSEEATRAFLRDWRRTLAALISENFYGELGRLAHARGWRVSYEAAFGDILAGDPLGFWKYADVPMCEFWHPHDEAGGSVGSDEAKPIRPCVSAAHLYGKRRVSAESFTCFKGRDDVTFEELRANANRAFCRGVTHLVFHTYLHDPAGTCELGTRFHRRQTWWKRMPELTGYFARCTHELERGVPVVDILWYLGDDAGHRPDQNPPFPKGYKYDYLNQDALLTRLAVSEGRLVLPDGMSYRAIWIPEGTFLDASTRSRLTELEEKGARVMRGELTIDWPSVCTVLGEIPDEWYARREGNELIFFLPGPNGESRFVSRKIR